MSLYNMMFGINPLAGDALKELGIEASEVPQKIPRFRDAGFNFENDEPVIIILTRTGGGNRKDFEKENEDLRKLSGFLRDEDLKFDSTFALFYFSVPKETSHAIKILLKYVVPEKILLNPQKNFEKAIEMINEMKKS